MRGPIRPGINQLERTELSRDTFVIDSTPYYPVSLGLMARILGFHPRGPGSIPGVGEHFFGNYFVYGTKIYVSWS